VGDNLDWAWYITPLVHSLMTYLALIMKGRGWIQESPNLNISLFSAVSRPAPMPVFTDQGEILRGSVCQFMGGV